MAEKRATIEFTEDIFEELVEGEDGWEEVSDTIIDHLRWSVVHELILRHTPDNTFWLGRYERGATESQDYDWESRWHGKTAVFTQVFPKTQTITVYE